MHDPRIGDLIKHQEPTHPLMVLIGFPSDEGVRRNGGRTGAAAGPEHIRRALYKLTPDPIVFEPFCALLEATYDAGNLPITGNLEKDQIRLGEEVGRWLKQGVIPIIIGGGHETAFGHYLGYEPLQEAMQIINFDAHPDVRPLKNNAAHSGSPFYQVLERTAGLCRDYTVAGLQRWSVARNHLTYLNEKPSRYFWRDEVDEVMVSSLFSSCKHSTMVSIDLDVIDQSEGPGVSAPAVNGFSSSLLIHAAGCAGKQPLVRSLDVVEMNPQFDFDGHTARVAAVMIWQFIAERCRVIGDNEAMS